MSTMLSTRLPSKLTGSGRMGMRADGAAITASCQDPSRLFSSTGLPKRLKKDHTSGTRSDQFITSVGQLINLKTNLMTSLLRREAIARNDILQLNLLIESIKVSQWHYHASHNKHFYA